MRRHEKAPAISRGLVAVRLSVHDASGRPITDAVDARLRRGDESVPFRPQEGTPLLQAYAEPGIWQLDVEVGDLVSPPRTVDVGRRDTTVAAYVGEKGWPFYRLGENAVPFRPPDDLVAVAFPRQHPDAEESERLITTIAERLQLRALPAPDEPTASSEDRTTKGREQSSERQGHRWAGGAVWVFQLNEPASDDLRARIAEGIRAVAGEDARVGVPVDLTGGQVKVIDNRFVVKFHPAAGAKAEERLKEAGAHVLRTFRQSPQARLVEFPAGDYRRHLATVEAWHEEGLLAYGEPDVMAQIVDDVFPDDPPNDPTYGSQANLTLQRVDVAWRIAADTDPGGTLGSPTVHVATLDRGVDTDHPDIGGNLTDGTAQIARCFDFSGMRECTVAGYAPDTDHGMGVYGIIAARTNNGADIAGIASNTHQIGLERPGLTDATYPDILLWAAGFTTGNTTSDWPAEPLSPGAAVISCSHGSDGLALSGIMDDTLQELADNGRGGRGTVVIYSAGNSNALITGFRTWAAHPDTLAIANSMQPGADGVERRDPTSNFGPEIDVCAQGTNAPSLDSTGGEQTFGGTSAAAPTVAGVAALMVTRQPALTLIEVRDALRDTAVQIDAANTDPVGQWVGGFSQWYGFGRIDAAGAVCGTATTVTQQTSSVTFNDIPTGETTVRAATFAIDGCEAVTLEVAAGPGSPFTLPLGSVAELGVSGSGTTRQGRIWIGYTATAVGDSAAGSVTVRWAETGDQWVIPISANVVARPTVALALVLDQSGSMASPSGIPHLPQRVDVLRFAAPPLLEVIHDDNALGVVSFDVDAHDVMPITVAGPPVFGPGRVAARSAVLGHTPTSGGLTAIGDGVERAHALLAPETTFDVRASIVFTDGHETAAQYIADVDHLIDERVYAIGLGTAAAIRPAALTSLTNGTGGYVLLTGELGSDDYFLLAKYYLQILAGVTNEDIVVDPQGYVAPGSAHRIPFDLTEPDISTDVLLLTPAPEVISFAVETPDGDQVTPADVAALPGSSFIVGQNVSFYRLSLPVPIGAGAAGGRWHALLEVDEDRFRRHLSELERKDPKLYGATAVHGVRYALNVHAYSNLRLRASLAQSGMEPGATFTVRAALSEYGMPVEARAVVRAELAYPDGTSGTLPLTETAAGVHEATLNAALAGVYRVRVVAEGVTLRGQAFTREQIVTGAVWRGGNEPAPHSPERPDGLDLCSLLDCLLTSGAITAELLDRFRRAGLDVARLRRCLCGGGVRGRSSPEDLSVLRDPRLAGLLRQLAELADDDD